MPGNTVIWKRMSLPLQTSYKSATEHFSSLCHHVWLSFIRHLFGLLCQLYECLQCWQFLWKNTVVKCSIFNHINSSVPTCTHILQVQPLNILLLCVVMCDWVLLDICLVNYVSCTTVCSVGNFCEKTLLWSVVFSTILTHLYQQIKPSYKLSHWIYWFVVSSCVIEFH